MPKALKPDTPVFYGLDAVALTGLDWQPRFVLFPGDGTRQHVERSPRSKST